MYAVVMFLYNVWDWKWQPARQDSRSLFSGLKWYQFEDYLCQKEVIKNTAVLKKDAIFLPALASHWFFCYCPLFFTCRHGSTDWIVYFGCFALSSNILLAMLKWEKLSLRRKQQKALIMYKTLNELAPDYLQCLFTQRHVNDYNLRNLEGKLSLPKLNTNYLKRSLCYSGACLWNNLPQDLKSVTSIGQFKRGIKKVSEKVWFRRRAFVELNSWI